MPRKLLPGGLPPDALDHVENKIAFARADALLGECVAMTGCAHFGLLIGSRWGLSQFGALGELMRHSGTVGDALRYRPPRPWRGRTSITGNRISEEDMRAFACFLALCLASTAAFADKAGQERKDQKIEKDTLARFYKCVPC